MPFTKAGQEFLIVLAVREIGQCLQDLGPILAAPAGPDNAALRANVADGLRRAAAHVQGQTYVTPEGYTAELPNDMLET